MIARKDIPTQHCAECNYCIEDLDHHCPWSGKCIGRKNTLMFKMFLVAICLLIVYDMVAAFFMSAAL